MNNKFTKIDMESFSRLDEYEHFTDIPCSFSMTADVDITKLYDFIKENNLKLYPVLVSVMAQVINEHKEYRYAVKDGDFGYYEMLHPLFFDVMAENKNVKALCAEYTPDYREQIKRIEETRIRYASKNAYMPQTDMPENVVNISCIPWRRFSNLSFSLPNSKYYYIPILTFGRLEKCETGVSIPLSVHVNHAVNDGYHASMLYQYFEEKTEALFG